MFVFNCSIIAPVSMQMDLVLAHAYFFTIFESVKIFGKSLIKWSDTEKRILCCTVKFVINISVRMTESSWFLKGTIVFTSGWFTRPFAKFLCAVELQCLITSAELSRAHDTFFAWHEVKNCFVVLVFYWVVQLPIFL